MTKPVGRRFKDLIDSDQEEVILDRLGDRPGARTEMKHSIGAVPLR